MEKKLQKHICYILQFIESAKFMASSLSNPVYNLSEGTHRIKYFNINTDMMIIM